MNKKRSINEKELDDLLRELYLEEKSGNVDEKEARFVLEQNYPTEIDPKKEEALIRRLTENIGPGNNTVFSVILLFVFVFTSLWMLFSGRKYFPGTISRPVLASHKKLTPPIGMSGNTITFPEAEKKISHIADTFARPKKNLSFATADTSSANHTTPAASAEEKTKTLVPFLPEQDKVVYQKVKQQMIAALLKPDKNLYTHVPAAKSYYAGKNIIIDAFTIRNVGITNLEYKTFLADLLQQKREAEYLEAQVYDNWIKLNFRYLSNAYFQDEKYNDFPVVNISLEGAKLFCHWLEENVQLYIKENHLKPKDLKIRLPYAEEWIYAAREGYAKIAYENGYNTIYDQREGLTDKSFHSRAELVKRRVKRIDTLYPLYTTNRYGWTEKQILDFFDKAYTAFDAFPSDTIYSDRMKVFGKIGRVSEMVPQKNSDHTWLSGLSWKSKDDYLGLENDFRKNAHSSFVGFRIVIINPDDPEYKNPFW